MACPSQSRGPRRRSWRLAGIRADCSFTSTQLEIDALDAWKAPEVTIECHNFRNACAFHIRELQCISKIHVKLRVYFECSNVCMFQCEPHATQHHDFR